MEKIEELYSTLPKMDGEVHREMYRKLHKLCTPLKDYDIDISPGYRLVVLTPKKESGLIHARSFNQMEYLYYILPEVLPLEKWKYGIGVVLHLRAKMDEYIRTEGKNPIEYLVKKFNAQ